jgi:uncharacterized membrane protein
MTEGSQRRGYLDWMRGLAVLIMIEAHTLDSWTRVPDRHTTEFTYAMILAGFGAPMFLFLAGVAVPLSAGAKSRKSGDDRLATTAVVRRGLEIFGLAFLFRLQSWVLGWGALWTLFKVDILNIMGPSIAAAALLWGAARTRQGRAALFVGAALAIAFLTPVVRSLDALALLPDPVEAYVRPAGGLSNFVLFPWVGFVLVGSIVGVLLDAARTAGQERRVNLGLAIAGVAVTLAAYEASFLPSLYRSSSFWTTSPAFFFVRVGVLTTLIPLAYLWEQRAGAAATWSPLRQLGRTSLFIYWIHVELVYGLLAVATGFKAGLSWGQAWIAFVVFTLVMVVCSILKERVAERWKARRLPMTTELPARTA